MTPGEQKCIELENQLVATVSESAAQQPTGHSVTDWVFNGFVGCSIMMLRLLRTNIPVPLYWQRTVLRAVEEIARELQKNGG